MTNTWVILPVIPGDTGLPGRFENVSTVAAAMAVIGRAERAAAGRPFLVRIQDRHDRMKWIDVGVCPWGWAMLCLDDFVPNTSDYFVSRGDSDSAEEWEFEQPCGQSMQLPRKSFVDGDKLKRALSVYLVTRKLWRGLRWQPTPDPLLLADEPDA